LKKETVNQLLRYGTAGIVNTFIGICIVYVLKDHVGIKLATLFNFGIGIVLNFFTTKKFAFKSGGDTKKQGSYFFVIFVFSFLVSYGIFNLLLWEKSIINALSVIARALVPEFVVDIITAKRYLSLTSSDMIATYLNIVIFAAFNFSLNKFITFKKEPEIDSVQADLQES
jgi:putative flippase GtrA